jgi:hypothetical protein
MIACECLNGGGPYERALGAARGHLEFAAGRPIVEIGQLLAWVRASSTVSATHECDRKSRVRMRPALPSSHIAGLGHHLTCPIGHDVCARTIHVTIHPDGLGLFPLSQLAPVSAVAAAAAVADPSLAFSSERTVALKNENVHAPVE